MALYTRMDTIYGNDVVSDAANSSRTQVPYAYPRGLAAYGNNNLGVAACWMAIVAAAGHSASQAFLALFLYQGNGRRTRWRDA
jgi:TPR repeat protein